MIVIICVLYIVYLLYFGDPALECLVGDIHSHFGVEHGLITVSVVSSFARVECRVLTCASSAALLV